MLDLDEAIKHAEETANNLELEAKCIRSWGKENDTKQGAINCEKCAKEHRQLAEWLRELKDYKDARVGCEYCKHNYREQHERPCSLCQRNFMDMFEREMNTDGDSD